MVRYLVGVIDGVSEGREVEIEGTKEGKVENPFCLLLVDGDLLGWYIGSFAREMSTEETITSLDWDNSSTFEEFENWLSDNSVNFSWSSGGTSMFLSISIFMYVVTLFELGEKVGVFNEFVVSDTVVSISTDLSTLDILWLILPSITSILLFLYDRENPEEGVTEINNSNDVISMRECLIVSM